MNKVTYIKQRNDSAVEISDETLLTACAKGDSAALGMLYRRHGRMVFRFLARMSPRDRSALDDLVQDVFLAINKSAGRFSGRSAVSTWILAIASNILKKHIRSESRRRKALASIEAMPLTPDASPHAQVEKRLQLARLSTTLDSMSYKLRIVFVMCDLEGIRGHEVARALGLRPGTVWSRLHEARRILCEAIEKGGVR